jgi:steroid delta-isomerase-like uncharacterized protein
MRNMTRTLQAVGAAAAVALLAVSLRRHRKQHDPEKIVRAYYDAWAEGDADAVEELISDDYVGHVHALGTEERDADALLDVVESHADAFDETEYEVQDVLRDDDRVAARVTMRARHHETGGEGEIDGLVIFRIDGGQIAEEWSSWDYLGLIEQLGLGEVS